MNAPLLELTQVRCSADETTLLDNVTFCTDSRHAGLSGKTAGVAALLEGRAQLLAGQVRVLGEPLELARKQHLFGCAVHIADVPPKWTVRQVLELAAEMAGYTRSDAKLRAKATLERVGLPMLLKRVWTRCSRIEQSIVTLALGLIAEPALLFVSLPLGEFRLPEILRYGPALSRATNGLDVLFELKIPATLPEELTWVSGLDSMTHVFETGLGLSDGPRPRGKVRYLLRVTGEAANASRALQNPVSDALAINTASNYGLAQWVFLVDVAVTADGDVDTGPVLDWALASGLDVLELAPTASLVS